MLKVLRLASRSLLGKALVLAALFVVLPIILYDRFEAADRERQSLLLQTVQAEGLLAAQALEPMLTKTGGRSLIEAARAVEALSLGHVHIRLLLRPVERPESVFLVAANPPLDRTELDAERQRLEQTGLLAKLDESCAGTASLAIRYVAPSGSEELLTSLSPVHAPAGCWVVVTSFAGDGPDETVLARPFDKAPEVHLAILFYGLIVVLAVMVALATLVDLRAFTRLAKRIGSGQGGANDKFAKVAALPELLPVARAFDRMVATLAASAGQLREAAEDNAHALKAPIAAITQSLEPLRQCAQEPRSAQAVTVIEQALGRLGQLVNAARRLDEAAAELMWSKRHPIDLAALARQMADAFGRLQGDVAIGLSANGAHRVLATVESLETIVENLLDNAIGFSPAGGTVRLAVTTEGRWVHLVVEDEGPGVPADQLAQIFRRNVSLRPGNRQGERDDQPPHFGIGLAVVRRTVDLLGGRVGAENGEQAGLRVTVSLPAA